MWTIAICQHRLKFNITLSKTRATMSFTVTGGETEFLSPSVLQTGVQSGDRLCYCLCKTTPVLWQPRQHKTHLKVMHSRLLHWETWNVTPSVRCLQYVMLCQSLSLAWTNTVPSQRLCYRWGLVRLTTVMIHWNHYHWGTSGRTSSD